MADPATEYPLVVLVVPCHNEDQRLRKQDFFEFLDQSPGTSILFVNDGSTDRTEELVHRFAEERPEQISVLSLTPNRGKGEAVRQGMLEALKSSATYIGFWDADLATPFSEIPRFVGRLEQNSEIDFVMGSRVRMLGTSIERENLRHAAGRIFATLAALVVDLHVYDSQCGAKVFRASVVPELFATEFLGRWTFDLEVLARQRYLRQRGNQVLELPLKRWVDEAGSKVRPTDAFGAFYELWLIYRKYA